LANTVFFSYIYNTVYVFKVPLSLPLDTPLITMASCTSTSKGSVLVTGAAGFIGSAGEQSVTTACVPLLPASSTQKFPLFPFCPACLAVAEALLKRGERVVVADEVNDYYDVRLKRANLEWLVQTYGADRVRSSQIKIYFPGYIEQCAAGPSCPVRGGVGCKRCASSVSTGLLIRKPASKG